MTEYSREYHYYLEDKNASWNFNDIWLTVDPGDSDDFEEGNDEDDAGLRVVIKK